MHLLHILNPQISLTGESQLALLRHFLGSAGQRFFDCYNFTLFDAARKELECIWGPCQTVFYARQKFTRLSQEYAESVDSFIVKLLNQVQACVNEALTKAQRRYSMLIQQLITSMEDVKCRESLMNEDASSLACLRCGSTAGAPANFVKEKRPTTGRVQAVLF